MSRYSNSVPQLLDDDGNPIVGAKKYFYEQGTTTLKAVYSDSNFATPITNPVLSVIGGRFPNIFLDGLYKEVQKDADDVVIWTRDPVGEIVEGQFEDFLNDKSYSFNDIVKGSDLNHYKSLVAGIETNQGNDPISSPTEWGDATFATVDGIETLTNKTLASPVINTSVIGTAILDEDDMSSDSSSKLATQQSIKAFVEALVEATPKLIMLDDWELLDSHLIENVWRDSTADFSESSTTLSGSSATIAIIQVIAYASASGTLTIQARKGGEAYSGDSTIVGLGEQRVSAVFHIHLDTDSDFEYIINTVLTLASCKCHLIGYYV